MPAAIPATIAARPAAFRTFPVRRNAALMRLCRCSVLARFCASASNRSASRAAVCAHFLAVLAALTAACLKRSAGEAIGSSSGLGWGGGGGLGPSAPRNLGSLSPIAGLYPEEGAIAAHPRAHHR